MTNAPTTQLIAAIILDKDTNLDRYKIIKKINAKISNNIGLT